MASYAPDHASALADLRDAGAAVAFSRITHVMDEATGLMTPTTTTIAGYAIRDMGRGDRYHALGLIPSRNPTLLFAASTFGDAVALGDTVTWGGIGYTVRDVDPVAVDGTPIVTFVVVGA